jgi:large subunit ribosomal protein L29
MSDTITALNDEGLAHRLMEVERELVRKRFQHSMGQLENTASLRNLRKEIARIKTEATRRESSQGLTRGSLVQKHAKTAQVRSEATAGQDKGGFLQGIVDKLSGND